MPETLAFALLALAAVTLVLLLVLLLRKQPKPELPAEFGVRLDLLQQMLQTVAQSLSLIHI